MSSSRLQKHNSLTTNKEKKIKKVQPSFNSSIKVAVRVRPKTMKEEAEKEQSIILVESNNITLVTNIRETHAFRCDHCFSSNSILSQQNKHQQQREVYECLAKPLLPQAFQGFNTCLFAYGQTGTGKSYSMMGKIGSNGELPDASGIVPRFCKDLFTYVEDLVRNSASTSVNLSVEIHISYFEIYNEQIQDLLCSSGRKLSVREHPKNGPYVVNLTKCLVTSFEEVQRWLAVGNRKRVVASTSQNKRSSRSHVIFTIMLSQNFQGTIDGQFQASAMVRKQSRINFIDLAGSERLTSTSTTGVRREESLAINLSLFTLGKVITSLAEKNFAPYRESALTWLLKDSLGGNSKTVMLATVSPSSAHVETTLSTLRYSCLAGKIINTARICEDPNPCLDDIPSVEPVEESGNIDHSPSRVRELESEARYLKTLLAEVECRKDSAWKEKVAQAELRRAEAEEALANYGLLTVPDPQQPYLVNVNRDPLLSQTMYFPLHPGQNWVGPMVSSYESSSIQLTGLMIENKHCCIDFSTDLKIIANAETYVNGQFVGQSEVLLRHGDRIVIGGSHFFHLHNPRDSQFNERHANNKVIDFETSYHELREVQEKALEATIKDAQEKARLQMISEIEELRKEAASEISFRRHFYEKEISSINRDSQERPHIHSPPLPSSKQYNSWQEIEFLLQDTQRQLEQHRDNSPKESSFVIQTMLNEANAICRRFQQPYHFSRKEVINEDLSCAVSVKDKNRGLVMHWTFETMRQRLKVLRVAVEESKGNFPMDAIFDSGDVWLREDDFSSFFAPNTRAKLEELLRTLNDSSIISPDVSKFSPNSRRRSSLLPRPPTNLNAETVDACRKFFPKFSIDGCLISTFSEMAASVQLLLDHPDRTYAFAIGLTVNSVSLLSIFPGLVDFMFTKREVLSSLRNGWIKSTKEFGKRLQNSLDFVMQGVALDSSGLFMDWIKHSKNALEAILIVYCELSVVFCTDASDFEFVSLTTALTGFTSAHKKVHESIIVLAEEIRMQIEHLPKLASPNPSFINNGCLVTNACYDSVHHVIGLLEELRPSTEDFDSFASGNIQLGYLHSKFYQRIDLLLRLGKTIEHLFTNLKNQVLSQVKVCAAALKVQAIEYKNLMGVASEIPFLSDLSFSVLTVHRHVGERKRKAVLQRGRDISYSPLPAQMLVTPSPKAKCEVRNV